MSKAHGDDSPPAARTSSLGAIMLLARASVHGRGMSIAIVVAVAAIVSGASLTAAAAARRTATVVDRMTAENEFAPFAVGTSYTTNAGDPERLRRAEEAIAEIPGVSRSIAVAGIFAAVGPDDGSWYLSIGTGLDDRYLASGWAGRPRKGRLPAADGRAEVALDAATATRLGLRLGDEFVVPTIAPDTIAALLEGKTSEIVADGPALRFTVVGILAGTVLDDPSSGYAVASPDTSAYLGVAGTSDAYFLFDGAADVDVQRAVDAVTEAMSGEGYTGFTSLGAELGPIRSTVDVIAAGLAVFAVLAAIAGLIALGQVALRQVTDATRLSEVARALGMRDRESAIALALPPVLAATAGIVLGVVVAASASPLFPTGVGRLAEPDPGVRIDWLVLTVGSLALVGCLAAWAFAAAYRRARAGADGSTPPIRVRGSWLRRRLPLPMAIGSGLVLARNRARTSVRPASALIGAVLAVSGVLAIAVFTASQRTTAGEPTRYGWGWDVDTEITADDPGPLLTGLVADPALAAVGVASCGGAVIGDGHDVPLCAVNVMSGSMSLTYLDGRAPQSRDEVAVGRPTMSTNGLAIGDRVYVTGAAGTTRHFDVVGVVVFPDTSSSGHGLITTAEGIEALNGGERFSVLMLRYADGLEPQEVERILLDDHGMLPDQLTYAEPPSLVARLDLVRPTLVALGAFLGTLGVIGLVHFLMLSVARRRSEVAVLGALGFVRLQSIAVVVWQSVTIASIGVVGGAPLGLLIGRTAWVDSVDQIGIVDTPTLPWLRGALIVVVAVVGAAAVGLFTGWLSADRNPSAALRQE